MCVHACHLTIRHTEEITHTTHRNPSFAATMPPAQLRTRQRFVPYVHETRSRHARWMHVSHNLWQLRHSRGLTHPRATHPAVHRAGPPRSRPCGRRLFLAGRGNCLKVGLVEELKGGAGDSDHHVLLESRGPSTEYPSARKRACIISPKSRGRWTRNGAVKKTRTHVEKISCK